MGDILRTPNKVKRAGLVPQIGQLIEQHQENGVLVNIIHNAKGRNDWALASSCQLVKRGNL